MGWLGVVGVDATDRPSKSESNGENGTVFLGSGGGLPASQELRLLLISGGTRA